MLNKLKELREAGFEEGFTLIELMIVVVIIGILTAIAIPIFANQQKSAIVAGVKSDVKNTNTNIATVLVKIPTAAVVEGTRTGDSGQGRIGPVGITGSTAPAYFDIVVSDSNTSVSVAGSWNSYTIVGWNPAAFTGTRPTTVSTATATAATNGVVYQVATGKTTINGEI